MAVCNPSILIKSACQNGFLAWAQSDRTGARAFILQQLYLISGSTQTVAQLKQSACDNGFMAVAQDAIARKSMVLQLLCNWSGA